MWSFKTAPPPLFWFKEFLLYIYCIKLAYYQLIPIVLVMVPDTSFMYVLAILTMMKIYQTRHPDITASSYTIFGVLAFVIFLGMFGVLNKSTWFYIVFTILHLWTCLFLTAQIYHMGLWKLGMHIFVVLWTYFQFAWTKIFLNMFIDSFNEAFSEYQSVLVAL